jgi:hypothetical protein
MTVSPGAKVGDLLAQAGDFLLLEGFDQVHGGS